MTILTINGTAADETIVVNAAGADSGTYSINGGPAIAFSGVTQLTVNGHDGNDTLTIINPTGGLFAPTGGISYDGGGQPADTLEILGGTAAEFIYTAGATRDAGTLTHIGETGTQTINFAGIAPITDTVAAMTFTITGTAGTDNITVTDGGLVGGAQTTQVSSPTFESIRFANKSTVIIDGQGGNDTISFNNPTVAAGLTTLLVGGVGAVTQTGAVNYPNLGLNVTGPVTLTANNDVIDLAAKVTGAGNAFSFNDVDDVTITSLLGVNGISTNNGAIAVSTLVGPILVANTGVAADVNAGTSTVSLTAGSFGATDSAVQLGAGANVAGTGGVQLVGDHIDFLSGATVNAGTATVVLRPFTAATQIDLGGADGANLLGLTDTELDGITAGILRIGDANSGRIGFAAGITPAGASQLELVTGADIQDNNIGTDVTVAKLAMTAGSGIGISGAFGAIDTAVSQIEAQTDVGGLSISNAGALTVGGVTSSLAGLQVITSGNLNLFANGTITLADSVIANGNTGGSVTLTAGAASLVSLTATGAVLSSSGDVTISADQMAIDSASGISASAPGHSVTIQPVSAGGRIHLGTAAAFGTDLSLSDADLDRITTPTLRIGSTSNTGDITVDGQITADGHYDTLSLRTGGSILDSTGGEQTDITVNKLALQAATGTGSLDDLDVAVSNLAFNVTNGTVWVANAAGLTLGAVDGLVSSSVAGGLDGLALVIVTGPLTVAAPVTATGFLELIAQDTAASGDDLTVLPGVALQSTENVVALFAGDTLTLQAGSIVQGATGVEMGVDLGSANADPGVGGMTSLNGTIIGAFSVAGNLDADILTGTPGDDDLDGSLGADVMIGGAGNDTYSVDNAGDAVVENANEGTDRISSFINLGLPANVENLTLQGSADLQGYGNALANVIGGNSGNNLLDGGAGADLMVGGIGNDTYFVDNASDTVTEFANAGNDTVFATANFALSANVENLILQGSADLQGYGNALANVIYGNSGNNLIDGGAGADRTVGGTGNDTYFVDNASDSVFESAGEGNDAVLSSANYGLSADVETLILQGGTDLQGYGNNQTNTLYGNTGNNLLNGAGGADLMVGGIGNDTYFVDNASDAAFENPGEGTDAVFSSAHYGLAADVETLVLQGGADLQGYGNNQANTIYGNSGNNLINGAGGADTMLGGAGNDTYFVDDAGDVVFENANDGTDSVLASVNCTLTANVEALVLQGSGNLAGTGNTLANSIFGNAGNNQLDGGAGVDVLTGNAGNDTFVFHQGQAGGDTIVDFAGNGAAAGDSLQLVGYGAGATFTNIDVTHWQVNFFGGSHDIITFMNGAPVDASDYAFI